MYSANKDTFIYATHQKRWYKYQMVFGFTCSWDIRESLRET